MWCVRDGGREARVDRIFSSPKENGIRLGPVFPEIFRTQGKNLKVLTLEDFLLSQKRS